MEDVGLLRTGVDVPEADWIAEIAVNDVRRIVGVEHVRGSAAVVLHDVQRGISIRPRRDAEVLELALDAVLRPAQLLAVREHDRAHAGGAVVDAEAVSDALEDLLVELREGLDRLQLVMEEDLELAVAADALHGRD